MPPAPRLHWYQLPGAPAAGTVVGHRAALPDGAVRLCQLPASAEGAQFSLLLLRSGERINAFANRCAHFGVALARRQEHLLFEPHQHLRCNVHYARFRWFDGVCDQGECVGESLLPIGLQEDSDGTLRIAEYCDPTACADRAQ